MDVISKWDFNCRYLLTEWGIIIWNYSKFENALCFWVNIPASVHRIIQWLIYFLIICHFTRTNPMNPTLPTKRYFGTCFFRDLINWFAPYTCHRNSYRNAKSFSARLSIKINEVHFVDCCKRQSCIANK